MAKRDVIDQARLSAYFTEISDDIFKEKLRRIVSIPTLNSLNLILSPTHVFFQYFHILTNFLSPQGFKHVHLTYSQAVMVMVKAEKRLDRKFTVEEIEDGTMGALLEESDFDIEKTVSTHIY